VKAARLVHCLLSIAGLVAANNYQTNYDGDNLVSIRLDLSGVIFLPRGHYISIHLFLNVGDTRAHTRPIRLMTRCSEWILFKVVYEPLLAVVCGRLLHVAKYSAWNHLKMP